MKVENCRGCPEMERRVWTQYYKPDGYHAIGMNHAYAWCAAYRKRCSDVGKCEYKKGDNNES